MKFLGYVLAVLGDYCLLIVFLHGHSVTCTLGAAAMPTHSYPPEASLEHWNAVDAGAKVKKVF